MIQCCKHDAWFLHDLPFYYKATFNYYDGSIEGITSCSICHQGFYYVLLDWDDNTDCRVFAFSEIDSTGEQLVESLGIKHLMRHNGGLVPLESLNNFSFSPPPATHLCHSDDGFKTGFWRRRMSSDDNVTDWIKYFGLIPPND